MVVIDTKQCGMHAAVRPAFSRKMYFSSKRKVLYRSWSTTRHSMSTSPGQKVLDGVVAASRLESTYYIQPAGTYDKNLLYPTMRPLTIELSL